MNTATLSSPAEHLKINARLGAGSVAQLKALTRETGLGVSEIVRVSLAHYHEAVFQAKKPIPKSKIVAMAGKYASTGPDSGRLSTDYKRIFGEILEEKYKARTSDTGLSAAPSRKESSRKRAA
jgi:Ribbon-helix-helix protein, copG family